MPRRVSLFVLFFVLPFVLAHTGAAWALSPPRFVAGHFKGFQYIAKTGGKPLPNLVFLHVRADAQPGDGSYEKPFRDLAAVLEEAKPHTVVYLWPGVYPAGRQNGEKEARTFRITRDLTLAGSGIALYLPDGGYLPAQTKESPLIRAEDLREYADGWITVAAALNVAPGVNLTLSGLRLEGGGDGTACYLEAQGPESAHSGYLNLWHCTITNFSIGVYSNGNVSLYSGNRFHGNGTGISSNGHGTAGVHLSRNNEMSDNRQAIYNPMGTVFIGLGNTIKNSDEAVFAGDIELADDNTIADNKIYGLYANKHIRIGNRNRITGNGAEGNVSSYDAMTAESFEIGNDNIITGNYSAVCAMKGDLIVGNGNAISGNDKKGLYSGGAGILRVGDGNAISHNGRGGLENQRGSIQVGNRNSITDNGEDGILCFNGDITLGAGNRVSGNRHDGIVGHDLIRLGGANVITTNRTDDPTAYGDMRLNQSGRIDAQPTDTVGTVKRW